MNDRQKNILIRNIRLTDASAGLDVENIDVILSGGAIRKLGSPPTGETFADPTVIDGRGLWLWPGLIDGHVHFREPGFEYKETFRTGSRAAARGGYTCVVCEPNTDPPLADLPTLKEAIRKARESAAVRTYFKAAMTQRREGRRVADYAPLAALEEVRAISDDGDPVSSKALMDEICRQATHWDFLLCPHCEDSPRALHDYEEGIDPGFHPGDPYTNETAYVKRDAALAARHGCSVHFSHLSLRSSLEAIDDRRNRSGHRSRVTCEATPHHLLLSAGDDPEAEAPSVNPPLRSGEDVRALQDALVRGRIDAIASDHAPHSQADKEAGACGLLGLETTLGLILTDFVRPGLLKPMDACRLLSSAPAAIFALPGGRIREGEPADLVFINPEKRHIVDPSEFESISRNTPFEGRRLTGGAIGTMVRGEFVYMDEEMRERTKP